MELKSSDKHYLTTVYQTIAPSISTKKELEVEVMGFDTKKSFRAGLKTHKKEIKVIDIGQIEDKGDVSTVTADSKVKYKVYSDLSRSNPAPIQYIWPAATTPNRFNFHAHSCRYFSDNKNATVAVMVYPDIKWKFDFFVNLSNSLSIKWQKLSTGRHEELRGKALKLAKEEKGDYTGVNFGVELKASFDKQLDGSYHSNPECTLKWSKKIKSLFSVISSVKKISQGITSVTKGQISKGIGRKLPFDIKLNAPALYFGAEWEADLNETHDKIGTKIKLFIEAKPLVELAIVFDLLGLAVQGLATVTTAGTGNILALEIYNMVKAWTEKGYETEKIQIKFKMYIDLEIKGKVDGLIDGNFSTINDGAGVNFELKSNVSVELKAGLELKGAYVVIGTVKDPVLDAHFEGIVSASASMGITSAHKLKYDSKVGVYYIPSLKIDPCVGKVIVMVKVGFTYRKISSDWKPINYNRTRTFYEGFDIMESLSKITGHESKILLWEKKK